MFCFPSFGDNHPSPTPRNYMSTLKIATYVVRCFLLTKDNWGKLFLMMMFPKKISKQAAPWNSKLSVQFQWTAKLIWWAKFLGLSLKGLFGTKINSIKHGPFEIVKNKWEDLSVEYTVNCRYSLSSPFTSPFSLDISQMYRNWIWFIMIFCSLKHQQMQNILFWSAML